MYQAAPDRYRLRFEGVDQTAGKGQELVVIGDRKRRRFTVRPSSSPLRRSRIERGSDSPSTGGANRALADFQNPDSRKISRQNRHHRCTVRAPIPNRLFSSRSRHREAPCRIADTSTTIAPT